MGTEPPKDRITINGQLISLDPMIDLSTKNILRVIDRLVASGTPLDTKDFHWLLLDELGLPPAEEGRWLRGIGTHGNRHVSTVIKAYAQGARAEQVQNPPPESDD